MEETKEERFVDDDGTLYVWNEAMQKYEPHEKTYDVESMTYCGNDEAVPSLTETLKEESAKVGRWMQSDRRCSAQ